MSGWEGSEFYVYDAKHQVEVARLPMEGWKRPNNVRFEVGEGGIKGRAVTAKNGKAGVVIKTMEFEEEVRALGEKVS